MKNTHSHRLTNDEPLDITTTRSPMPAVSSDAGEDAYVSVAAVSRQHGVSMSTLRRRIREGKIKSAIKKETDFGERWLMLRSEAETISLEKLSPKRHLERGYSGENRADLQVRIRSLEERVARLERLFLKHLSKVADE